MERPDIRERIASAVTGGSMQMHSYKLGNADYIAAMAFSDRLGSMLIRLKYANQAGFYKLVLYTMLRRLRGIGRQQRWRSLDLVDKLCPQLLKEWLLDVCPTCLGRGVQTFETYHVQKDTPEKHRVCPTCDGERTIKGRWQDRCRALNISREAYLKHWAGRFDNAEQLLLASEAKAAEKIRKQLRLSASSN